MPQVKEASHKDHTLWDSALGNASNRRSAGAESSLAVAGADGGGVVAGQNGGLGSDGR